MKLVGESSLVRGASAAGLLAGACSLATLSVEVVACVGDDPVLVSPPDLDAASDGTDAGGQDAGGQFDAPPDSVSEPRCRAEDPFETPVELANVNIAAVSHPRLTADELEIFFQVSTGQAKGIYVARRGSPNIAFEPPQRINTSAADAGVLAADPSVSADGNTLFVTLDSRIARMVRADRVSPFGAPELIGLDDPSTSEEDPHIVGDKSALFFVRRADGGATTIWRAPAGPTGFGNPSLIALPGQPQHPSPTDDELTLYYADLTDSRIHRVTSGTTAATFGSPTTVEELNISAQDGGYDRPGWLSPDQCRMYFTAGTIAGTRIHLAKRQPR